MEKQKYEISFHNFFDAKKDSWTVQHSWTELLEGCEWIRGCVAYWTIGTNFFENKLAKALSHDDSFFCVHLDHPTKLEALNEFHHQEAKLCFYNIFPKTKFAEGQKTAILHAKVTMFGLENGEVDIWIGSYNMTPSALCEMNIEACTVIHTNTQSEIYQQVNDFLEKTRDICEPYDPIKAKWLQIIRRKNLDKSLTKEDIAELYGLEEHLIKAFFKTQVIFLVGVQVANLVDEESLIQIIGLDNQFNDVLSVKQKKVLLYIQEAGKKEFYYYTASIQLSGDINTNIPDSHQMEFSKRRFAFLEKNLKGAVLESKKKISSKDLEKGVYVTSLKIESVIPDAQIFPFPTAVWEEVVEPINVEKLSSKEREHLLEVKYDKKGNVLPIPKQIRFKELKPDFKELQKEVTKDVKMVSIEEYDALVGYYTKELKSQVYLFEEKTESAKSKVRNRTNLSNAVNFKQSYYGRVVVEKES